MEAFWPKQPGSNLRNSEDDEEGIKYNVTSFSDYSEP